MEAVRDDEMILVPKREILDIIALLASAQLNTIVRKKNKVTITHELGAKGST